MDRKKAISFMHDLLRMMVSKQGSDLFIFTGSPPAMKVDGEVTTVSKQNLSSVHTQMLARSIMNDKQLSEFEESQECNFSIELPGVARFRVTAFVQRGSSGLVLRTINSKIPSFDDLNLPPILKDISMTKRGLVIFVGGTGSGKSTSLASMVDYRNKNSRGHITTIEDPVEFVHDHGNCLVTQREVGVDTESYEIALKNTLRQAPDVILIGEIRDRETMEHAIAFAETGHLCLSTLHANSSNQALDRIINFFPEERRVQLLMDLSLNLKGLVSQRLIPKIDGAGRIPAIEVMLNTPLMADLIFNGNVHEMKSLIAKSNEAGMQSFDQSLFQLYEEQEITFEDALRNADSVKDLRLRIKLESDTARKTGIVEDHRDFELEESEDDIYGGMLGEEPPANRRAIDSEATSPSIVSTIPIQSLDKVHFSITSLAVVAPGDSFVIDLWAHLERDHDKIIRRVEEELGNEPHMIKSKGPVKVARGSVLSVKLKLEGFVIDDSEDTLLWEGEIGNATFAVMTPKEASEGRKIGVVAIFLDGLRIARIHFVIRIGKQSSRLASIPTEEERHLNAFASYASADRDEVLRIIQGIQKAAPGLNVFFDVLSLRSGQYWNEELWEAIPKNDVFYLFWSPNAINSQWVEKEWRCALETKGIDFIDPAPLVSPEEAPPPPELADRHFNDWTLAFRRNRPNS